MVQNISQPGYFGLHWNNDYAAGIMEVDSTWPEEPISLQVLQTDGYGVLFSLKVLQVELSTHIFSHFSITGACEGHFSARATPYQPLFSHFSIVVSREAGHNR